MVLAFAIFIVSSSATQDMSKLETRFEQAEKFWFWDFLLVCGSEPQLASPPPSWAAQGPEGPFAELFSARGAPFVPFFPCFSGRKKNNPGTQKSLGTTRVPRLSWSWKRDLNTRPADYESAALPTELFQHIHFFHSVCLLRLQLEAQCVSSRLFTLSDNQRPADYESAALPTELFQHIPISVTFYPLRLQPEAQCVPARLFTLSNNQRPAHYE